MPNRIASSCSYNAQLYSLREESQKPVLWLSYHSVMQPTGLSKGPRPVCCSYFSVYIAHVLGRQFTIDCKPSCKDWRIYYHIFVHTNLRWGSDLLTNLEDQILASRDGNSTFNGQKNLLKTNGVKSLRINWDEPHQLTTIHSDPGQIPIKFFRILRSDSSK